MPCAPPLLRFSDCPSDTRAEAGEVMSGILEMLGATQFASPIRTTTCRSLPPATKPQPVFVRVYRTSSEHFAVLYPARAIVTACRPLTSLNLKSCSVKELPNMEFRVSPRSMDGTSVIFKGTSEIARWLQAFSEVPQDSTQRRKKVSDHRLPLPVLVESEEDDESATE